MTSFTKFNAITNKNNFDVILIGGSYAGLSAGMALGRALRNVLIINNGKPCNSQTPHSLNFLTQDGKTPKEISTLAKEQVLKYKTIQFYDELAKHNIKVVETAIDRFEHNKGQIENIYFKDGSKMAIKALYARPVFEQHCTIPKQLGCELTEQNYIKIDPFQKTTKHGIYACGDNTTPIRSVANILAMGALSGVMVNRELTEEEFG